MYFVGVDLGTSGMKAGVIDQSGRIVSHLYWDTDFALVGPGRVEQSPEELLKKTAGIIREVVERAGVALADIAGIALDGQMGGVIGVDDGFMSLTGLDMGLDVRSERYNARMYADRGSEITRISCGSPRNAAKIAWWKNEEPAVYKRVRKFVTLNGYVAGNLAGLKADDAFIDYTLLAFFGNENAATLEWSDELTSIWDIAREKLPAIVNPWHIVGSLTAESARMCGLKSGTPIVAGAGDQPAGFIGANFTSPGSVLDVCGSSTLLFACSDEFLPDLSSRTVMYIPSVVRGLYHPFTYINGGGLSLSWFKQQFLAGRDGYELLTEAAATVGPGSVGLLFIPYFGGRQCPYSAHTRGGWVGLNWGHTKAHLFRAILEAIAYDHAIGLSRIVELFDNLELASIAVIGGGAGNRLWNQIKADVIGVPFAPLRHEQYTLRGCALLAGYGTGVLPDLTSSFAGPEPAGEIFRPQPANHEVYKGYLSAYAALLASPLESTFRELSGLQ